MFRAMHRQLTRFSLRQFSKSSTEVAGVRFGRARTQNTDESLFYAVRGNGPHAILMLPGALGSGMVDLKPQFEGLDPDKYTLIALDPRGYGKSRPPFEREFPANFYERDAHDAHKVMTTLGWGTANRQYSVLGWSDGAIAGMIIAGTQSDAVRKLVIWGGNAFIDRPDLQCYDAVRDVSKWSAAQRQTFESMYGARLFAKIWTDWCDGMHRIYKERNGDICRSLLNHIECATLLLHGDRDPLVPSYHPLLLKTKIKHVRYRSWPTGKHNIHVKYAAEFNNWVQAFLDE